MSTSGSYTLRQLSITGREGMLNANHAVWKATINVLPRLRWIERTLRGYERISASSVLIS